MTTLAKTAASGAAARPVDEVLAGSRRMVDPVLRAAINTLPESMRLIAGYHFGWWDAEGGPTDADSGKAIRPALVVLTAEAISGLPAAATAAVPAAVAVELVHNFSLLHDDVMDGDPTRRHRPTAWRVFGPHPALLAGSALLALAFEVLAGGGQPAGQDGVRVLGAAVQDLLDGQSADLAFEQRPDVSLAECVRMTRGKTAALISCACTLGASLGGGRAEQVERLRDFGERLGMAFQHIDDLLGIWGDPAVTGKPVYADLYHRKKSLPVVAALASGTPAGHELTALYQGDDPLTEAELARAAALIDVAGGRDWCQQQADDLLLHAQRQLQSASLTARAAAELSGLARLITRRDQ